MANDQGSRRPRVALYTRVGGQEQVAVGFSMESQEEACRRKLDEVCGKGSYGVTVFRDPGYSGGLGIGKPGQAKGKFRPALTEMVKGIDEGRFNVLIAYRLDRLTRCSRLWSELLEDHVLPRGVKLMLVCEPVDTGSAVGQFGAEILAAAASLFRKLGGENVTAAHARRLEAGYHRGRPGYGWRLEEPHEPSGENGRRNILPIPEQRQVVQMMVKWHLGGISLNAIAERLRERGIPSPRGKPVWPLGSIWGTVRNPVHCGYLPKSDGSLLKGRHYPNRFYDLEVYEEIMREAGRRKKFPTSTMVCSQAPLSYFFRCGECGARLYVAHARGRYRAYRCQRRWPPCKSSPYVRGEFVESKIFREIEKIATDEETLRLADEYAEQILLEENGNCEQELARIRKELNEIEDKSVKWADLAARNQISEAMLKTYDTKLETRRQEIHQRIAELEAVDRRSQDSKARLEEVKKALRDFPRLWEQWTPGEQKKALDLLIEDLRAFQRSDHVLIRLKLRLSDPVEFSIPAVNIWRRKKNRPLRNPGSVKALTLR